VFEESRKAHIGSEHPIDWPSLAMAKQGLSLPDEGRRWLKMLCKYPPSQNPTNCWAESEICLLRGEALILYDPVFPADPSAR
jgi:hypothetical protein